MKIEEYTNCNELIIEANELYKNIKKNKINKDYELYFKSMNKYINKYEIYRKSMIKKYIEDLKEFR